MFKNIFNTSRHAIYIAEIGLNHNGDALMARDMITAAAAAGADAVKFQTFVPELMNSPYTTSLIETGKEGKPDRTAIDFLSRFVLTEEEYIMLQKHAEEKGVVLFSSPFDKPSVELLERIDVPLYKIASSEVTNYGLIRLIAKTGKPVIMSTGIASEDEIAGAIDCFKKLSNAELVLLHCVSLYPVDPENLNLKKIDSLIKRFALPVGFSDHSRGGDSAPCAAVLGARVFEKHFTVDRNYDCPDKDVSLAPQEFSEMIDAVESAVMMLGEGKISYGVAEEGTARAARRSLFARRTVPAGKILEEDDLVALRPGTGISPGEAEKFIGKKVKTTIESGLMLRTEFFN